MDREFPPRSKLFGVAAGIWSAEGVFRYGILCPARWLGCWRWFRERGGMEVGRGGGGRCADEREQDRNCEPSD